MLQRFYVLLVLIILMCGFSVLNAQVKITVNDAAGNILPDARIQIFKNEQQIAEGLSDINGQFSVLLPEGNYELIVFKDLFIPARLSVSYRNPSGVFIVKMVAAASVVLDSLVYFGSAEMAGFNGNVEVNRQQYRTMTASFQDPSRIMIHFPGFTTDNDGTNSFTFRGMPSYGHSWMIDNVEIVNPNHLATAGNRGDALSLNSGGVNSISGSVIGGYTFISSPASVEYDNIMAGVSNVKLSQNIRNFADFNLVGFEAGLGNTYRNKRFYATYRYSFVGLLEQLGISFGNESIQYRDFTFHGELYKSKKALLKSYFIYGNSSNRHAAKNESDLKEIIKDFKNIEYQGNVGIGGISFVYNCNSQQTWNINFAISQRRDSNQEAIDSRYSNVFSLQDKKLAFTNQLVSFHSYHDVSTKNLNWKSGFRQTFTFIDLFQNGFQTNTYHFRSYPYSVLNYHFTPKFTGQAGTAAQISNIKGLTRASLNFSGSLKYEMFSFLYSEIKYRRADFAVQGNLNGIPITAQGDHIHFVMGAKYSKFQIRTSLYTHYFSGMPVGKSAALPGFFNGFHGTDFGTDTEIIPTEINYSGNAKVYGWDIFGNVKQDWNKHILEILYSMSLFSSKYKNPAADWDYSRNDVGYVLHSSIYYSLISKSTSKWIAGISYHQRGGQRDPEIRLNPVAGESIYSANSNFSFIYGVYKRFDVRLVFSKSGPKGITHRFSLDIQNIVGNQNEGLRYFDAFLNTVVNQNQLGLVPVLGYRIEY